jgi:flagellar biosynthesis chaperone FliJ
VGAQTLEPPTQDVGVELAQLNTTLLEIKEVLSQQLETDSLDLLLKRSELVSADVARLDSQLRNAEAQRQSMQDDEERYRAQIEGIELEVRSGAADASAEEYEAYARQMTGELDRTRRRIRTLDGEIQALQNRLTAKQRDLDSWQDLVDRRLGGV